ncbi:uncharacterized protein LAJ45_02973 [Morchella importuna]|uniref:uncharacterized protein n=1 Tax=Morchella importuna TaxID=1174673 RepID=UPI001E8D425D|nr:uncharacterized protein LAJ45_02973 [Morchella importuna]KAH8152749.1 hypothetical protein LAJ45_02973 [Morchella importuna]
MEYSLKKGAKAPFWNKIRTLLKLEIDKDLKHPDHTIKQMSDERRILVQQERKESGTVQLDSEMDQNLDRWIEREDELLKEKQDAKKPMDALEHEAAHAAVHRDNLLLSCSNKRMYVSEEDFDSDDTEDALLPETPVRRADSAAGSSQPVYLREGVEDDERDSLNAVSRIRRMRKRARNQDRSKEETVKEERIVSALGNVGALMAGALEKLASSNSGADRAQENIHEDSIAREDARRALNAVDSISNELTSLRSTVQTEIGETKDMLRLILERLGSGSNDSRPNNTN